MSCRCQVIRQSHLLKEVRLYARLYALRALRAGLQWMSVDAMCRVEPCLTALYEALRLTTFLRLLATEIKSKHKHSDSSDMHIFLFACKHRIAAVAGKEGTELDDLWHEAPRNEELFFPFFPSCECHCCRCRQFTIGQDEIIEEISKLSLQGGLEQAVNILAAGRSSAAAVHPRFTAAPCS